MEYIICLTVYLVMMIGISVYSNRKTKTVDEFALGGRSIPPWMSAFSYGTAYFSAVILVGHAGKNGWTYGISSFWIVIGNSFLGTYLAWKVLGRRTREMTQRLGARTMPQFLGIRYQDPKIRFISAIVIFVFLVPYASSVYKGLGALFEITFHIDESVIMLIMTVVTAIYLFAGGFLAASIADFIQGIIMLVGVLLLIFYILTYESVDGVANGIERLSNINEDLVKPLTSETAVPLISLVLMTSLGTWGLPQMISKFYTIKSENSIKTARRVSTIFAIIITAGAYTMGSFSRLIIGNIDGQPAIDGKVITYDQIVPNILNCTLPKIVIAILLVVILAASMSTLAAIVLASSTTFVMDLVKPIAKDRLTEKKTVLSLKLCCLLFIVCSYILAIGDSPILNLNALSWGVVCGVLLAPYLMGLYYKNATKAGVYSAMIVAIVIMSFGVIRYGINSSNITTVSACSIVIPNIVLLAVSAVTKRYDLRHIQFIYKTNIQDKQVKSI